MLQNCRAHVKLKCTENKGILIEKKVWVCSISASCQCSQFFKLRRNILKEKKRCFVCLKAGRIE